LERWLRFLAEAGFFVGPVVTVGTYVLDAWHLFHLGLPPQALEGLGALIFFLSVGGLLYRWKPQPPIPVLRPSMRPTGSTTLQQPPPPTEYGDLSDLIERWSNDHFPGSAVARDAQVWNVVHRAKEELKPLLRRALFSRFIGTASYVTGQAMTDRARYPSNPHPIAYGANLARDVDLLRVFVDFSWETEHGQWTQRNRLFLTEFQNQTRGQRIFVPVLTEEDHTQPRGLQWGNDPLDEKQPMRRFPRPIFCRARLVLKGDDRSEQYYYFIVVTQGGANSIAVAVDQMNLEFPDQWFAEDIRDAS
jgi:hypothetical protein